LVSERDQNFRLDAVDGSCYTLKISNEAERQEVVDFQNRALLHVAQTDASLPLPRVIADLQGQLHCRVEHNGKSHFVRVLSWLKGTILGDASASAELSGAMGRLLARLGLALQDFAHPGSNPPLLWDMKRAAGLRELLPSMEDPGLLQPLEATLDRFDSRVLPLLGSLRSQVIHNDMNPANVLIERAKPDEVCGLIDFGDLVRSPLIIDLAVAAAYQLGKGRNPLTAALPLIAGYNDVRPLRQIEMELLVDLVRTRLATSLLIASYRVSLFPENRNYLMVSYDSARDFLVALDQLTADEALQCIQNACSTGRVA
jgi:Ser/Thr protein kinase RdoA (MazF antagonist)